MPKNKIVTEIILLVLLLLLLIGFFSGFTYFRTTTITQDLQIGLANPSEEAERGIFADAVNLVQQLQVMSFWLLAIAITILFGVALLTITKIRSSFKRIMEGLANLQKGKMDFRIKLFSDDEFGAIADSLNKTMIIIANYEKKLETKNKELQDNIDQLQLINRLTIGRELKMAELKEEVKKLKRAHAAEHSSPS